MGLRYTIEFINLPKTRTSFILYNLVLDKKYSTFYSLISFTKEIWENVDKENIVCSIFVDLQKASDTVEHDILLTKLEHDGISGIANNCFKSFLFDRKQFVSINGYVSNQASVRYGVRQGSVLDPLKLSKSSYEVLKIHDFADDTNLFHFNKSISRLNRYINLDIKKVSG